MIQQRPLLETENMKGLRVKVPYLQMPQPPLRPPVQTTVTKPTSLMKPPRIPVPSKPELIAEECLDDFFVTNTQIQRELSPPSTPQAQSPPNTILAARLPTPLPAPPPAALKPPTAAQVPADLLAFISTQDLDFSIELTQITRLPAPQGSPDLDDEDFPDDELEDIVLEFSLESPIVESTPDEAHNPKPDFLTRSDDGSSSHYDSDDAELQAGLQSVFKDYEKGRQCQQEAPGAIAEWEEAFDLSTQDLMELET